MFITILTSLSQELESSSSATSAANVSTTAVPRALKTEIDPNSSRIQSHTKSSEYGYLTAMLKDEKKKNVDLQTHLQVNKYL